MAARASILIGCLIGVPALAIPREFVSLMSDWEWPSEQGSLSSTAWTLQGFETLVVFGDSYSDDSRLAYFASHNGTAPPVGYNNPANYMAADGGRVWPQYVKQYAGVELYNYAVAGSVCSNSITPRAFTSLGILFPAVEEYEVPAYLNDSQHVLPNGKPFMIAPVNHTVYAIWIGVNDLGADAFLTDSQIHGTNLVDYTECVYRQIQRVYDNGGRYFVIVNTPPTNLAPLYALPGMGDPQTYYPYWPDKPNDTNMTQISYRMMEQIATVNAVYKYQTAVLAQNSANLTQAKFAVYDVHGLMTDIYNNPSNYLNGSTPLNVTGVVHQCDSTGSSCISAPNPDSYMWYDTLHPSEQVERVVAREFVSVVKGMSDWAAYW